MLKYRNRKTIVDGIMFDSKREAERYQELCLLEKAGEIKGLECQVKFELIPKQYADYANKKGLIERECVYIADFTYYRDGEYVVEDVKGMRTKDYIIKRKLMLHQFCIRVTEVD